ncbi:unnamed protein product [Leptidea sinapis]|uniref:Uncharacterized protein n=1 Tax=Leptidea sinapis TaxID=189913 RepID=A0A5E4QUB9_9NEOP|nr:unnamed protein product [Leptidea sinapis]
MTELGYILKLLLMDQLAMFI